MKKILLLATSLICCSIIQSQEKTDKKLQQQVEQIVKDHKGTVGVYIRHLRTNKVVQYQADTIFPTASMIKIPILLGVMDKIKNGELQYHQPLIYSDSLLYAGSDILGSYKSGEKTSVSRIMMLMLTMSDNTASLWLQSLAGTGTRINALLDSNGFKHTRVNSRTPGREEFRTINGWGQTTPREMVLLMEKIYKGQLISKESSATMLRLLGRNFWDEVAISQIPPEIFVASKNGAVNGSRSETLLVMAPHGPYIFSVITKNNTDQSWAPNNEAWVLIRKISKLLWNHYERSYGWTPSVPVTGRPDGKIVEQE